MVLCLRLEMLEHAHALHPNAQRALLVQWADRSAQAAILASGDDLRSRIAAREADAPAAPVEDEAPVAEATTEEPPTDVQPIYMAFVDPDNLRAVTKLVAIVPASADSTAPAVYQRKGAQWVADPEAMTDLNSTTPPPVVPLDSTVLNDDYLRIPTPAFVWHTRI